MKKFYLVMSIIFIIITFASIFLVFSSSELNAGYTVIPMLITLSFSSVYRKEVEKEKALKNEDEPQ